MKLIPATNRAFFVKTLLLLCFMYLSRASYAIDYVDIAEVEFPEEMTGELYNEHNGSFCLTREDRQDRPSIMFEAGTTTDFRSNCNMDAESILTVRDDWTFDITVRDLSGVGRSLLLQSLNGEGNFKRYLLIEWVKVDTGSSFDYDVSVQRLLADETYHRTVSGSGAMQIRIGKNRTTFTRGNLERSVGIGFLGATSSKRAKLISWRANDPRDTQAILANSSVMPTSIHANWDDCLQMGEAFPAYGFISQFYLTGSGALTIDRRANFLAGLGVRFDFPRNNGTLTFGTARMNIYPGDINQASQVRLGGCAYSAENSATSLVECNCENNSCDTISYFSPSCENDGCTDYRGENPSSSSADYEIYFHRENHTPDCAVFRGEIPLHVFQRIVSEYPPSDYSPQPQPTDEPGDDDLYCWGNPNATKNQDLDWDDDEFSEFTTPYSIKMRTDLGDERFLIDELIPIPTNCGYPVNKGNLSADDACKTFCNSEVMRRGGEESNCETIVPNTEQNCS